MTVSGGSTGVIVSSAGTVPGSELNMTRSFITMPTGSGLQIAAGAIGRINDNFFSVGGKAMDNQGTCESASNNRNGGNTGPNTGAACVGLTSF